MLDARLVLLKYSDAAPEDMNRLNRVPSSKVTSTGRRFFFMVNTFQCTSEMTSISSGTLGTRSIVVSKIFGRVIVLVTTSSFGSVSMGGAVVSLSAKEILLIMLSISLEAHVNVIFIME